MQSSKKHRTGKNNANGSRRPNGRNGQHSNKKNGQQVSGKRAQQAKEKYLALAKAADDRIDAENYYQHAEHYIRILDIPDQKTQQPKKQNNVEVNGNDFNKPPADEIQPVAPPAIEASPADVEDNIPA